MRQRKTLNQKRLTKKAVQHIIETEGKLHEYYTNLLEEKSVTGFVKRDKIYELPGDRFLYVFDENGLSIRGNGDIYPRDYFLNFIKWNQRVRDDYKHNRGSSVDHWRFYSKYKADILGHIYDLIVELSHQLKIEKRLLDGSYKSLDLVSTHCEAYGLDNTIKNLYDNLVIYIGEVIRLKVNGWWEINKTHAGGKYPYVSVGNPNVQYMALNVVWSAMSGLEQINFRKETTGEVRRNGSALKFYRGDYNKS